MQTDILHPLEIVATNQSRIDDLLAAFLADQDIKDSTRTLYRRTMQQYFKWINDKGYDLGWVTRVDILAYKEALLTAGLTSLTVGSYITSVRRFYEWAESHKHYPNVAKGVKSPRKTQQFKKQALTQLQSVELVAHARQCSARDFAIVSLLIRTGLRTIEVIRATIGNIEYRGGKRVLMVHGEGRHEADAFVIITDKCWAPLEAYLNTRPDALPTDPLFVSTSNNSRGQKLTTHSVSKIAKRCLKCIGLDNRHYTCHSLRHTTAVNILRAGGSIEHAQGVLRHSSPATTQIYTHTIKEEMRLRNAPEELLDAIF